MPPQLPDVSPYGSYPSGQFKSRSRFTLHPMTRRGVRIEMDWDEDRDPTPEEIEDYDREVRSRQPVVGGNSDREFKIPLAQVTSPVTKYGQPLRDIVGPEEKEPETWWGGFSKGLREQFFGDPTMLEHVAHPQELRDVVGLLNPGGFMGMPAAGRMIRAARGVPQAFEEAGALPGLKGQIRDVLDDPALSAINKQKISENIRGMAPAPRKGIFAPADEAGVMAVEGSHDERMAQRIYDSELRAAAKRKALSMEEVQKLDSKTQRMLIRKMQDDAVLAQDGQLLVDFPKPKTSILDTVEQIAEGIAKPAKPLGVLSMAEDESKKAIFLKRQSDIAKMRGNPEFQSLKDIPGGRKMQLDILNKIRRGETVLPTEAMPKLGAVEPPPMGTGLGQPLPPVGSSAVGPEFMSPEWRKEAVAGELGEQGRLFEKLPLPKQILPELKEGWKVPTRIEQPRMPDVETGAVETFKPGRMTRQQEFWNVAQASRQIMSSGDLSAPFRQAVFLVTRPQFWKNLPTMVKSLREKNYLEVMEEIESRPTFNVMQQAGVSFTDLGKQLNNREERFMSTLLEDMPWVGKVVKPSAQAYTAFLNKTRADVAEDMMARATNLFRGDPERVAKLIPAIARYVNTATGRGYYGTEKMENSAMALNSLLFAPRLAASRLQLLNPVTYLKMDPFLRKEAIRDLVGFTLAGSSALALGKYFGADVEVDPRSADFGKMRFGKTRIDMFGGFTQYIRFLSQMIPALVGKGATKSTATGKIVPFGSSPVAPTAMSTLYRFVENKEAPIPSFITGFLSGKDYKGDPFKLLPQSGTDWGEIAKRFTPMVIQDTLEVLREDPTMLPLTIPASTIGMNVQSYTPKRKSRAMIPFVKKKGLSQQLRELSEKSVDLIR